VIGERDPGVEDALHQAGKTHSFGLLKPVVSVTAGEYFFAPSIASLGELATKED
jgi:hypothetical protein